VLEVLLVADGAPVSARELLDRAWDAYVDPFGNVVKVTISRLRRKLGVRRRSRRSRTAAIGSSRDQLSAARTKWLVDRLLRGRSGSA